MIYFQIGCKCIGNTPEIKQHELDYHGTVSLYSHAELELGTFHTGRNVQKNVSEKIMNLLLSSKLKFIDFGCGFAELLAGSSV
jgi:hypothetical protein